MLKTSANEDSRKFELCVNIKCFISLIEYLFLQKYYLNFKLHKIKSVQVCKIDNDLHVIKRYVIADFYIYNMSDEASAKAHII